MPKRTRRPSADERKLHVLAGRFEEEAELERRDIARQLHDDIGQDLTVLVFLLNDLRRSQGEQPPEALAQAQEIASGLIAKVRNISIQVRPPIPDRIGLLPTFEAFLQELADETGVLPAFTHTGLEKELPPHMATATYLVAKKAATCLGRSAPTLDVAIRVTVRSVSIRVAAKAADGKDVRNSDEMKWVRDRAEYLGGTFDLRLIRRINHADDGQAADTNDNDK